MARRPTPRLRAGFARRTAARKRQGVSPLRETGAGLSRSQRATAAQARKAQTRLNAKGRKSPQASSTGLPGKPAKAIRDRSPSKKRRATRVARRNRGMR